MKKLFALLLVSSLLLGNASAQFSNNQQYNIDTGTVRTLCSIRGVDFNSTADQACIINPAILAWDFYFVIITNCSIAPSNAVGGMYVSPGKVNNVFIPPSQAYSLVAASGNTNDTFYSNPNVIGANVNIQNNYSTIYFSLTTAQGSAVTCDLFFYGDDLT